jgi:hypothetical protein
MSMRKIGVEVFVALAVNKFPGLMVVEMRQIVGMAIDFV